jgi:hypothetical protein
VTYTVRTRNRLGTGASGQLFPGPSAAEQGFTTFEVPPGFTYESSSNGGVYDGGTRLVTWTPSQNGNPTVTLTLPSTAGSYPAETTIQFTGIGESSPEICQNTVNLSVFDSTAITGTILSKLARGIVPSGDLSVATGATSGNGNFAQTIREFPQALTDIGVTPNYQISLSRNVATLEGVHVFDAVSCLSLGDGLTPATAYDSPAEGDPVCTDPAFHVTLIRLPAIPLDNQVVTVTFADGTTAVIPNASTEWLPPAGSMVASITIDGDYDVDDPDGSKSYHLTGWPASSLPADESRYQRNTVTVSGNNFDPASVFVGMQTIPSLARLFNRPVTNTYGYTASWSGSQERRPWTVSNLTQVGAVAADPALTDQRRWAVLIPDDSGIVITGPGGGQIFLPTRILTTIPWTSVTPDFNGSGATRYLSAGEGAASLTGVGGVFFYGGPTMGPGVYQYDTYAGFTDSDPSDGGASCTAAGGTLVTDTTGIIGAPGVPRMLCKATNTIIVTSPSGGMRATKEVANLTQNSGFVSSLETVQAASGDTVAFRVRLANLGIVDLTNLTVYDILPHFGDTGVIDSQTNVPRGSTVTPQLSGVSAPTGWLAEYTTSFNPCRPEVGVATGCDDTIVAPWSGTMPASGTVKLTAATLPSGSFVDIVLTFTVPASGAWSSGDVAWNSVGAAARQGAADLPSAEPPRVGFAFDPGPPPPSPSLGWKKTDTGGTLLAGAVFRLTGPGGLNISITDNQAPDADPDAGEFLVNTGLVLGNYTITETTAPPLYVVNTTPLTATVTTMGQAVDAGTLVNQLATNPNPTSGGTVAVPTLSETLLALLALALAGIASWNGRRRV